MGCLYWNFVRDLFDWFTKCLGYFEIITGWFINLIHFCLFEWLNCFFLFCLNLLSYCLPSYLLFVFIHCLIGFYCFVDFIIYKHFASIYYSEDQLGLNQLESTANYLFHHIFLASFNFTQTYFSFACLCFIPFELYFIMIFFKAKNCCQKYSNFV